VVSELATGPKSRVQTRLRQWIFKGDKNPQHTFLRMGSKAEVPCRKILRHVKIPLGMSDTDRQNSHSFAHSSFLPDDCWLDCQRALADESGVFPSRRRHHHGTLRSHSTWRMNSWWRRFWDTVSSHHNQSMNLRVHKRPGGGSSLSYYQVSRRTSAYL
jgi:hypothetical protein